MMVSRVADYDIPAKSILFYVYLVQGYIRYSLRRSKTCKINHYVNNKKCNVWKIEEKLIGH